MANPSPPPLDSLWKRYLNRRRLCDRNALVERYLGLAHDTANRFLAKACSPVDADEVVGYAYQALIGAIEQYDPTRGMAPATFVAWRTWRTIIDLLRQEHRLTRLHYARAARFQKARDELDERLGRPPTEKEHAKALGVDMEGYRNHRMTFQAATEYLFSAFENDDGERMVWEGARPNGEDGVENRDLLERLLRGLSDRERLIVVLYHLEGLTMNETAAVLEVSESRVSQMNTAMMGRLQEKAYRLGYRPCRPERSKPSPGRRGKPRRRLKACGVS